MIYFDHAATAGIRPDSVGQAMLEALREASANPGRSGHRLSLKAARLVEDARLELAGLFGAPDPSHVVLTKNATESLNLVLFGLLGAGDVVLASGWEHNAVLRPLRYLESARGVRLEFIPGGAGTPVDLDWMASRLEAGNIALVAVTAACNVTGEISPVGEIGALCRRLGAFFLIDGAQGAGVVDLDVERDAVSALAVTGHKSLYGPTGTGALYLRDPDRVAPLICGGTGSRSQSEEQPGFLPDKFEAGTANVPGLAGLAAGVRHVRAIGVPAIRARHQELATHLRARLEPIPGLRLHAPADPARSTAVAAFTIDGLDPAQIARELDLRNILCRPGLQCAPRAHQTLGTLPRGTVRFSLSPYNSEAEIDEAAAAVLEIARKH